MKHILTLITLLFILHIACGQGESKINYTIPDNLGEEYKYPDKYWLTEEYYLEPSYKMSPFEFNESKERWEINEFGDCCHNDPDCDVQFDAEKANNNEYSYGAPCFRDFLIARFLEGEKTTHGQVVKIEGPTDEPDEEPSTPIDSVIVSDPEYYTKEIDTCYTKEVQFERRYRIRIVPVTTYERDTVEVIEKKVE